MALLTVSGITKMFGGVHALEDVSFDVPYGSLIGLIGPNGAGKTTLFNCISGFDRPNAGSVAVEGSVLRTGDWRSFYRAGIRRTFQNTSLFDSMTVRENVLVALTSAGGRHFMRAALAVGTGVRVSQDVADRATTLLESMGQSHLGNTECGVLPAGQRRMIELTRLAATSPRIALLDEPAAGLNPTETAELSVHIQRLRDMGITVVVVEHDLRLVMNICDEVVVIDQGRKIAEGPPHMIQRDPVVIDAYLGVSHEATA